MSDLTPRLIRANPMAADGASGPASSDRIAGIQLSQVLLPLAMPISAARVLTGRQMPLTEIALVFAEIRSQDGHTGLGFSYSKRAGGNGQFAHAQEIAPALLGEDPNDIARLWDKLVWAGASVGRSGLATQAMAAFDIALWDMKARRAGLPLAKLLGAHRDSVACYNTSGGFLSSPLPEVLANVDAALERGIGGLKIKVGQPDPMIDLQRVQAGGRACRADPAPQRGHPAARRAAGGWHHADAEDHGPGRAGPHLPGAALRDGDPCSPGCGLPA